MKPIFDNADKEFRFRKEILFATHPQRFFAESKGSAIAVRQDLMAEVAHRFGALEIDFDTEYYQAQNWRSKVPSVYELAKIKAQKMTKGVTDDVTNDTNNDVKEETEGMTKFLSLHDAEDGVIAVKPEHPEILRSRVREWCQCFEIFPHSNATTPSYFLQRSRLLRSLRSARTPWTGIIHLNFLTRYVNGSKARRMFSSITVQYQVRRTLKSLSTNAPNYNRTTPVNRERKSRKRTASYKVCCYS